MRGQPIAQPGRQIVDKRKIPEVVLASPKDPVGFEWVAAVGNEKRQAPPGSQHTHNLARRVAIVLNVFEHLV